jgi:hypothetical protein
VTLIVLTMDGGNMVNDKETKQPSIVCLGVRDKKADIEE